METEDKYPEHHKLERLKKRQAVDQVGAFLEWLLEQYSVCEWKPFEEIEGTDFIQAEGFYPVSKPIEQWLALYYGVDLQKLEQEKRALLEELRASMKSE